jgi:protein-tyrosine-phosphatase
MDISNRDHLRQRAPGRDYFQRIFLMRAFEQEGPSFDTFDQFEVPDPYFGAENGFYGVYEILDKACRGYLNWLRENHPHLRSS